MKIDQFNGIEIPWCKPSLLFLNQRNKLNYDLESRNFLPITTSLVPVLFWNTILRKENNLTGQANPLFLEHRAGYKMNMLTKYFRVTFDWIIPVFSSCWVLASDADEVLQLTPRWKCFSQCFFNRKTEELSMIFTNTPQETFIQVFFHKGTHKCQCSILRHHRHSAKASFTASKC